MRSLPRRERVAFSLGLVALLSAGCVKPGPPGVQVAPLKADIVFGVKEPAPAAAPANIGVATPEVFIEDTVEQFDEKVLEIPDVKPIPRTPVSTTQSSCPAAALTAFPKVTAEPYVQGMPTEGIYRYKRSLSLTQGEDTVKNEGFEQHVVRRVTPTPGKTYEFSYEVVQPDNTRPGEFVVTTYRVNSNPAVVQSVNRPPQTIGVVPVPGVEQVVTPPMDEPGIFVDKIIRQDKNGGTLSTFEPVRPLKYLPLDEGILKAGQTFESIAIDPQTSSVVRHQGTVVRKTRVDACGEIVEGWLIEATQFHSDDAIERRYLYNVGTPFGGLFLAETTELQDGEKKATIDVAIANPTPQPLPENLK